MRPDRRERVTDARTGRRSDDERRLLDHSGWRPEWVNERPRYWWYLTFEQHTQLRQLVGGLQERLRHVDAVELIPRRWLHLTLQDIGFVDELDERAVSRLAAAAAEQLSGLPAVEFALGHVTSLESALALQAHPAEAVTALRSRLRLAMSAVLGPSGVPGPMEFRPHVSLAYLNRDCDAVEVLDPVEGTPASPLPVTVPWVSLVAVTRGERSYRWTTCAEILLDRQGARRAGAARDPLR